MGMGEQVRGDKVGHAEAGDGNQRRGVQQVGVPRGPRGQDEGEEEGGAGDAGEGAQMGPRGCGERPEGLGGGAGGRKGEECWDSEGRQSVGQALNGSMVSGGDHYVTGLKTAQWSGEVINTGQQFNSPSAGGCRTA